MRARLGAPSGRGPCSEHIWTSCSCAAVARTLVIVASGAPSPGGCAWALAAGALTVPGRTLTSQCLKTLGSGLLAVSRFCLQLTQVAKCGLQHPQWH